MKEKNAQVIVSMAARKRCLGAKQQLLTDEVV